MRESVPTYLSIRRMGIVEKTESKSMNWLVMGIICFKHTFLTSLPLLQLKQEDPHQRA